MPPRFPTIFETLANAFRMPAIVTYRWPGNARRMAGACGLSSKQGGENNYAFPRPATTKREHFLSLQAT